MNAAPASDFLLGDAESYYSWALRLVSGDWAGDEIFYQAPLYPYFLGVLFSVFEPDPSVVRWAQALIGSLACVFLVLAGRRWFSPGVGILAGFLLAFYAPAIFFTGIIQKTTVALFLFTLFLWLAGTSARGGERRLVLWGLAGGCLALAALTRENVLILPAVVAGWLLLEPSTASGSVRLRHCAALLAGIAFVLGPVALRNYAVGGELVLTTSQLGANLYIGNNEEANGTYQPLRAGRDDPKFEAADARALAEERAGRPLTPKEVSAFYVGEVADYIKTAPLDWASLLGRKTLLAVNAVELADTEDQPTHAEQSAVLRTSSKAWHFGILLPLALVGGVVTWSRRRDLLLLYAMLLASFVGLVVFFIFARYRFTLVPILMMFAAAALVELCRLSSERRFAAVATVLAAGVVVAVPANWPIMDEAPMRAVTLYNYGLGFERAGDEELARKHYLRALSFHPRIAEAHYRVGVLDAESARIETAIEHFRRAVDLSPDYYAVRNSLGALYLRQGDALGAEEQFKHALRLAPKDTQALNNLASIKFRRGDLDEARELYLRSAEHDPKNPQTHNNLGIIAAMRGEIPRAIGHFEDALALDPGYEEARLNLARAQSST